MNDTLNHRESQRLAILLSLSGDGGVERMVLNLAAEFAARGIAVDLVLLRAEGGHVDRIPTGVRVVRLGVRHASLAVPALVRYLRRARPTAMLVAKDRAGRAALRARWLARVPTRVVLRLGNTLSESVANASALRRWLRYRPLRAACRGADAVVAVSEGVAEDIVATTGIHRDRIQVIRNPVITDELERLARGPAPHPWLAAERDCPVILAMGRLARQKDFPTLLRAFARVRQERPCRLIILGEGRDRPTLEALAAELGIAKEVLLPGFQENPYPWLAHADLFVLSSAWEGSPNALTEALALGIPVVSTDCRSGPREILRDGELGALVPVGDDLALADAVVNSGLEHPPTTATLRQAANEYRAENSANDYLRVLESASSPTTWRKTEKNLS